MQRVNQRNNELPGVIPSENGNPSKIIASQL